ncbi:MAG: sigma-70 family RNA polymerase sigma factor [Flavobacteriales bacterium]|nr:sigma-70 family RNA polymerase sigma factor [Flavobacteriales bacterium]
MNIQDNNIASLLRDGSNEAYRYVYTHYFPLLCKRSFQIIQDIDTSQDLAHEMIIKMWEKRNDIKDDQKILSYLLKAVYNSSLNYIRDESRKQKRIDGAVETNEDIKTPDYTSEQELLLKINQVLEQEDELRQKIFRLNRFEGLTTQEIGKQLDIPISKVQYNIGKVMVQLHIHLKEYLTVFIFFLINTLNN